MAEQFLHSADIAASFQQVCGETMSQRMASGVLRNARSDEGLSVWHPACFAMPEATRTLGNAR